MIQRSNITQLKSPLAVAPVFYHEAMNKKSVTWITNEESKSSRTVQVVVQNNVVTQYRCSSIQMRRRRVRHALLFLVFFKDRLVELVLLVVLFSLLINIVKDDMGL